MRILEARIHGFNGIRNAHLDLSQEPEGTLFAVTGTNGAGKTTLSELLGPGIWFNWMPSRACKVSQVADHTNAELWVKWQAGDHVLEGRMLVDPDRGTHKGMLTVDGEPQGRELLTQYLEDVAAYLPPRDVFLATAFRAQRTELGDPEKAGHMLAHGRAGRKRIYGQIIGLDEIQTMAGNARSAPGKVRDRLKVLDEGATAKQTAQAELEQITADLATLGAELGTMESDAAARAEEARIAGEAFAKAAEARQAWERESRQINERLAALRAELAEINKATPDKRSRLIQLQEIAAAREGLEADVADHDDIKRRRDEIGRAISALQADRRHAAEEGRRLTSEVATTLMKAGLLDEKAIGEAEAKHLAALEKAETARALADAGAGEMDAIKAKIATLEAEWLEISAGLTGEEIAVTRDRARVGAELASWRQQAALVSRVPCKGERLTIPWEHDGADYETVDCGACELLQAAKAAAGRVAELEAEAEAIEARGEAAAEKKARGQAKKAEIDLLRRREQEIATEAQAASTAEREARSAGEWVELTKQRQAAALEAKGALADVNARADSNKEKIKSIAAEIVKAEADFAAVGTRWNEIQRGLRALQEVGKAEAEAPHVREWLDTSRDRAEAIKVEGIQLKERQEMLEEPAAADDLGQAAQVARQASEQAARALKQALEERGRKEGRRGQLKRRIDELEAQASRAESGRLTLAAVDLLARSLGDNGIQAHLIDGSAPEVTETLNQILGASYGDRFQAKLLTAREGSKKGTTVEAFDVVVYDGKKGGKEVPLEMLSGGEQVNVVEALQLALSIYRGRRNHSTRIRSFWRDEASGQLDAENAPLYPLMLRKAMEVGGFGWGFYVSQRPEVYKQADVRIHVDGGRVSMFR